MQAKIEIAICLGSACFARGNNRTRKAVEDFIRENGLWDKVHFHGVRCFDNCQKGPLLKVGDTLYEQVNEGNVNEILSAVFFTPA